jgi:hypothetical protein
MIQIDGKHRHVFIKFTDNTFVQDILTVTKGTKQYKHSTGEISTVRIKIAGMGTRRIRLANLPPELSKSTISTALTPYGVVQSIQDEIWSKNY